MSNAYSSDIDAGLSFINILYGEPSHYRNKRIDKPVRI